MRETGSSDLVAGAAILNLEVQISQQAPLRFVNLEVLILCACGADFVARAANVLSYVCSIVLTDAFCFHMCSLDPWPPFSPP